MARIGITYSELAKAAADLAAAGKNPTVDSVREVLGSGSKSTIAPLLKRWKAEHEAQRSVAEAGLPAGLLQAVRQLHEGMQAEADARVATAQTALDDAKAGFQADLAEARATTQALADERDALQDQLHEERAARLGLQLANQDLQLAAGTSRTELAGTLQRLHDRQQEISHLRQQMEQLRAQFEHYQEASASRQQEERRAAEQAKATLEQALAQQRQIAALAQATLGQRELELAQVRSTMTHLEQEIARRDQQKKRPRRMPRRR